MKDPKEMTNEELINRLKTKISNCDSDLEDVSWGMQEGILFSKYEAQQLLSRLQSTVSHELPGYELKNNEGAMWERIVLT